MPDRQTLFAALRKNGISVSDDAGLVPVGGGDISAAFRIDAKDVPVFIKTGPGNALCMFEAEAAGLRELRLAGAIKVPEVFACGESSDCAYLAMEWLAFERPTHEIELLLGQQLAALHRHVGDRFGWHRDNTIGMTPQRNDWSDDWLHFFKTRRLGFQLELASENGHGGELRSEGQKLADNLEALFLDYEPQASLLHGDLWGGNWAAAGMRPVIFDPAVYYGDRESDIAMTRLFGGFGPGFYAAYLESWPLAARSEARMKLYQLYHVLNHLNLFGRAYLGRALQLTRDLNEAASRIAR